MNIKNEETLREISILKKIRDIKIIWEKYCVLCKEAEEVDVFFMKDGSFDIRNYQEQELMDARSDLCQERGE